MRSEASPWPFGILEYSRFISSRAVFFATVFAVNLITNCLIDCAEPLAEAEGPAVNPALISDAVKELASMVRSRMSSLKQKEVTSNAVGTTISATYPSAESVINGLGGQVVQTDPHGDCMHLSFLMAYSGLASPPSPQAVQKLREDIAAKLRQIARDYDEFAVAVAVIAEESGGLSLEEYISFQSVNSGTTASWGDHVTLMIIASIYNLQIVVVPSSGPIQYVAPFPQPQGQPMPELQQVYLYFQPELHYQAVVIPAAAPAPAVPSGPSAAAVAAGNVLWHQTAASSAAATPLQPAPLHAGASAPSSNPPPPPPFTGPLPSSVSPVLSAGLLPALLTPSRPDPTAAASVHGMSPMQLLQLIQQQAKAVVQAGTAQQDAIGTTSTCVHCNEELQGYAQQAQHLILGDLPDGGSGGFFDPYIKSNLYPLDALQLRAVFASRLMGRALMKQAQQQQQPQQQSGPEATNAGEVSGHVPLLL